ncbi:MAG: polysaccharide lyase 6 family protein [Verrucomicrobiota bacterium]
MSRFLALALLGLSSAGASAKDFAVATREEFDAAVATVRPGDSIVWAPGTWSDVKLRLRTQGAPGRPVTLRAAVPGETRFEAASELTIDGEHLVVSGLAFQKNANVTSTVTPYAVTVASVVTFTARASHCRLTETSIVDSGDSVTTYVHLAPGNVSNRVDHCYFSNQGKIGVTFYVEVDPRRPNGHLIERNYFGDRKQGTGNRWETLRIGHSEQQRFVSNTTVSHNYFYRCNGENECVSNKSTGNRYLYNTFVEVRGELALRHGDRTWVEGNYFFGGSEPKAGGVRIIGSDQVVINNYFKGLRYALVVYNGQTGSDPKDYAPVDNALVAFNTLDNCVENFTIATNARPIPPKNLRIVGNLVRASSGSIFRLGTGVEAIYASNVMFGAELGFAPRAGISSSPPALLTDTWDRIMPGPEAGKERLSLPRLPEAEKDLNGEKRTSSTPVGAIATHGAKPLYPLARKDVGPAWMKMPGRALGQ